MRVEWPDQIWSGQLCSRLYNRRHLAHRHTRHRVPLLVLTKGTCTVLLLVNHLCSTAQQPPSWDHLDKVTRQLPSWDHLDSSTRRLPPWDHLRRVFQLAVGPTLPTRRLWLKLSGQQRLRGGPALLVVTVLHRMATQDNVQLAVSDLPPTIGGGQLPTPRGLQPALVVLLHERPQRLATLPGVLPLLVVEARETDEGLRRRKEEPRQDQAPNPKARGAWW